MNSQPGTAAVQDGGLRGDLRGRPRNLFRRLYRFKTEIMHLSGSLDVFVCVPGLQTLSCVVHDCRH